MTAKSFVGVKLFEIKEMEGFKVIKEERTQSEVFKVKGSQEHRECIVCLYV